MEKTTFSSWDTISSNDIIQSLPFGIIITDYDEKVIKINEVAEKLLDLNVCEVLGKPISSIPIYKEISNILKKNNSQFLNRKNGYNLIVSKNLLIDADKKYKGFIYIFYDISKIEANKNEIMHELNCQFESLIESSHDGIILIDHEKIVKVNNSYLRISGLRKEEVEGLKIDSLLNNPHI